MRWDRNYGYAGGYNRALKIAAKEGIEFAYLLNNDCLVIPGFLSTVVKAAKANPTLAAVGSRIVYADQPSFLEYDGEHYRRGEKHFYMATGTRIIRQVIGAGMLIQLAAMERHGYFDERFFCYHEETEWCLRVQDLGQKCAVCAESLIKHKSQSSNIGANTQYYLTRNLFLLLERTHIGSRKDMQKQIIYDTAVVAEEARRTGDWNSWEAIAYGLYDGVRAQFGERPKGKGKLIPSCYLIFRSLQAHLQDKWRSIQGIPPGTNLNSIKTIVSQRSTPM